MDEIGRAVRRMEDLDACKDKDLGGAIAKLEEHGRDWRSMDEIGGAVRRMEEFDACKDKLALFENLGSWKSYDLGGARTRVEEQGRDWRSLEKDKTTII